MFKLLLVTSLFITSLHAAHLPLEREYQSMIDTGYTQYGATSLHHSFEIVLTFDDGIHPVRTPQILDILKEYKAHATFFILTKTLNKKTLPILKRMLDEGHIVASHGEEHYHANHIDAKKFKKNMKSSILKLNKYVKMANHKLDLFYYRFPYAEYGKHKDYHHLNVVKNISHELFNQNCIHFVFWDQDSGDWVPSLTPKELLQNIKSFFNQTHYFTYKVEKKLDKKKIVKVKKLKSSPLKGGIVLFHDIQKRTVNSLKSIMRFYQQNNIRIKSLDQVSEFTSPQGCTLNPLKNK